MVEFGLGQQQLIDDIREHLGEHTSHKYRIIQTDNNPDMGVVRLDYYCLTCLPEDDRPDYDLSMLPYVDISALGLEEKEDEDGGVDILS